MSPQTITRRQFTLGGLSGAVLLAATACGAGGTSSASGNAITVLVEAGGHAELQAIADQFKKDTGVTVTFVELPYDGLFNRLSSEFSSSAVSFDVAALDSVWLPSFKDSLQPIDELFTAEAKSDIFPSLVKEANIGGHFLGMPAWTNAEIVLYRKDLFAESANIEAFKAKYGYDLAAPTTWKQYRDMAEFFTKDGMFGTDVKGAVETEYLAHVLQAGSPMVLDSNNNVIIDNAAHKEALDFYTSMVRFAPAGAAQVDWAAAQNLFNQGKTAMTRFWAHAYRQVPKDSPVYGKVGAATMIAGSAGVAGVPGPWYLSVPKNTKNAESAKKFIKSAFDNNELAIGSSLGLAARVSAYQKYQDQPGYESFKPLVATLNAPATATRPATAKWQQIVDTALVPMLQKAVAGGDNAVLLSAAKQQIQKLLK